MKNERATGSLIDVGARMATYCNNSILTRTRHAPEDNNNRILRSHIKIHPHIYAGRYQTIFPCIQDFSATHSRLQC